MSCRPFTPAMSPSTLRAFPYGVLVVRGGVVRYSNRAAEEILGFSNGTGAPLERLGETARAVEQMVANATDRRPANEICSAHVFCPAQPTLRLQIRRVQDTTAVLVTDTGIREVELLRRVGSALKLSAIEARMAVRIFRKMDNQGIANALGIPIGTVKSRMSRLYARLGVAGRVGLIARLAELLPRDQVHEVGRATGARADRDPALGVADGDLRLAVELLSESSIGLTAIDVGTGQLEWWSEAGKRLRDGVHGRPATTRDVRSGTEMFAALAPLFGAGDHEPGRSLEVRVNGIALCGSAWRLGRVLVVEMHRKTPRTEDLMSLFVDTFQLTPRQAQVAMMLATNVKPRDIAMRLGVADGTIRSMTGVIYDKLGASSRLDLVSMFSDMLVQSSGSEPQPVRGS